MIPHYVVHHQTCEWCEDEILIGYEALLTLDGFFCSEECYKNHLYEMNYKKEIVLTSEKIHREVM